jgi:protein phosphatase
MNPHGEPANTELPPSETTRVLPGRRPGVARAWFKFGGLTHPGKGRPNNEDQYLIARANKSLQVLQSSLAPQELAEVPDEEGYLMLVADGLGGHAAGERASALVVNELQRLVVTSFKWFYHLGDPDEADRARAIQEGLGRLDRQLFAAGRADWSLEGMGTTLTAASLVGAELTVVHVGDSRAYLFRGERVERLTQDHTVAQVLVNAGRLRPEEAKLNPFGHVLTNALGGRTPGVRGEIRRLPLADGDRVLLCTDGLTDLVSDDRIAALLGLHAEPEEACRALVDAALAGGGRDDISVVLAACTIKR